MIEGVFHRARFRMARIEKHQNQIGQIDNVVGNSQRGISLGIGVKTGGIDQYLALDRFGRAGFELQVCIDALALARSNLVDIFTDIVERKTRIGVQRQPG